MRLTGVSTGNAIEATLGAPLGGCYETGSDVSE